MTHDTPYSQIEDRLQTFLLKADKIKLNSLTKLTFYKPISF